VRHVRRLLIVVLPLLAWWGWLRDGLPRPVPATLVLVAAAELALLAMEGVNITNFKEDKSGDDRAGRRSLRGQETHGQ